MGIHAGTPEYSGKGGRGLCGDSHAWALASAASATPFFNTISGQERVYEAEVPIEALLVSVVR